jgi:hypothetical protein
MTTTQIILSVLGFIIVVLLANIGDQIRLLRKKIEQIETKGLMVK